VGGAGGHGNLAEVGVTGEVQEAVAADIDGGVGVAEEMAGEAQRSSAVVGVVVALRRKDGPAGRIDEELGARNRRERAKSDGHRRESDVVASELHGT
jgi:hypothetical protein